MSLWNTAHPWLRDLVSYEPGKPIEDVARELGLKPHEIIKLASNENPLGPSPKALAAMRAALDSAHLYPDGGGFYLREALARKLGFSRDHLILGAGSNEIIEFLGHAFLDRGDEIVTSEHAFVVYKLVAAIFAGRTLVALRTFSKIQGLANLRIGYGIARPELIQVLHKTRQPFNVSGLAQAAALAGLEDEVHRRETKRITDEGRDYLQKEFAAMNLQFVPSLANFVLVNVGEGAKVFRALLDRRIIVRALKGYNLAPWLRISVGTMEQNRRCIAALKEILAKP